MIVPAPKPATSSPSGRNAPFISVAVPTCNRPEELGRCLGSLALVRYPRWELIVVDQSDDDQARAVLAGWSGGADRVVCRRVKRKNASTARNLAIEDAKGDILAFLDDDCSVDEDWLNRVAEAFEIRPSADLVFGSVHAEQHDRSSAFLLQVEMPDADALRGASGALRVRGLGAAMYLRLASTRSLRFDARLGPGAPFRGAQDQDFALRLLWHGRTVVQTARVAVTHHGARPYKGGTARQKLFDYGFGAGACHAKLLRCGQWVMFAVICKWFAKSLVSFRPHHLLTRQPTHTGRLVTYVRGLAVGFRTPVDRQNVVFRRRPG